MTKYVYIKLHKIVYSMYNWLHCLKLAPGPIVQGWINTNPHGLKLNLLFWFVFISKLLKVKNSIGPDSILEKYLKLTQD